MKIFRIICQICILFGLLASFVPGVQSSQNPAKADKTIKIGLLISDNKSVAAKNGAEMAIRKANEKGGYHGYPFELIVRSMEGPWGTGAKEAVNMIFDEGVVALLGSHDGRNAHLVEQVTTKARVVFLSAWASDPTLSQAFVPWYFSCVPNDLQQASALIEEIYERRKIVNVVAVSDDSYDSNSALKSFVKKVKIAGKADPLQLNYNGTDKNFDKLLNQISKSDVNGVVLFGQVSSVKRIILQMRQQKMNLPVFCTLSILNENELSDQELKTFENVVMVTSGHWFVSKNTSFRDEFQKIYGYPPGAVASYAFDGMYLIIEAIKNAGLDRENIQKALSKIRYEGVTGSIQFDEKGNRSGTVGLMEIKNGKLMTKER
jgi:branched-chain amino acid transport system substrate-binding protein